MANADAVTLAAVSRHKSKMPAIRHRAVCSRKVQNESAFIGMKIKNPRRNSPSTDLGKANSKRRKNAAVYEIMAADNRGMSSKLLRCVLSMGIRIVEWKSGDSYR